MEYSLPEPVAKRIAEFWDIQKRGPLFWEYLDDEDLREFIWEALPLLMESIPEAELGEIPEAYEMLYIVQEFEGRCLGGGWYAVINTGEEGMRQVIAAYTYIGLGQEAAALQAVLNEYVKMANPEKDYVNVFKGAYRSVENAYPEYEDRLGVILKYVRDNPQEFSA